MVDSEIVLDTKLVGSITGDFYIPSYQRGYRWGEDEVTRLLDDVYNNGTNNYCLQPIVVRRNGDRFEYSSNYSPLSNTYLLWSSIFVTFMAKIIDWIVAWIIPESPVYVKDASHRLWRLCP